MIAAIAIMGGHDVKDDKVRTLAYASLYGNAAKDILKDVGNIGKKVGFRLLTKFGSKGVVNLSKEIPLVGGATGAVMDGVSTNIIGNTARNLFIN